MSAGGFSFNEDGGCINESKESLAGVGDGIGAGEVAFSCAGGCVFSALLQCEHCAQKSNAVELPPATLIALLVHSFFALRGSSAGFTYLITNGPMPWTWIIVSAGVQA